MSREWKPGDVAMVSALNRSEPYRAFFDGKTWRESGRGGFCVDSPTSYRPLVVIDPEDREQVERLYGAIFSAYGEAHVDPVEDHDVQCMQAALREFANPTPPSRWTNGDVIQSVATDLVWMRDHGTWQPANGEARADDDKVDQWVALGVEQCRILREQAAERGVS